MVTQRYLGNPVDEIEEIRELLLGREREELRALREQIDKQEQHSDDVAAILPEAIKISGSHGDQLSRALLPVVERSIQESINKRPEILVDILHPVLGPILRRSIVERVRRLFKSLTSPFDQTFSWQGVKWRFEALRTGKSFAEIMMLRTLVYRVEQVFLIHRATGMSLLHVTAGPDISEEPGMIARMLNAIHHFAVNSFKVSEGSSMVEFRFRQMQVWIAIEHDAYLAATIRGIPSGEVRSTLKTTIENIHVLKGSALARFPGETANFESLRPELESCLLSQYGGKRPTTRAAFGWAFLVVGVATAILGIVHVALSELHWKNFLFRLNAQPGLVVTEARKGWLSRSSVSGLRDPSATDPDTIAREEKLDPSAIRFQWKTYLALDPASVMERFKRRFDIPQGTSATINDGVLSVSGTASYEWLERVRREAPSVPGVTSVADRDVEITYDPGDVLRRFQEEFSVPGTVHQLLTRNVLTLSGEAPHRWLTRVRSEATRMPGITSVDERYVVDLDQRTFKQSGSIIDNAFVPFLQNNNDVAAEGFVVLARLPDQFNRLAYAAKQIGGNILIEILGYPDNPAGESNDAGLGQQRADKVRDFLVLCGVDSVEVKPIGMRAPLEPNTEKPGPKQLRGGVGFHVVFGGATPSP
jgi:OOP family OmpA-OmpF porin